MSSTAVTAKLLTAATTSAIAPADLEPALEVVATLHDRRRPAGYFLTAELATVPALVAAGIVRRFRDGREEWLELDDDALEARVAGAGR